MTIRTRILLVYLLLIGGGYVWLVGWILGGIRPRYLESTEESLVDTANILAAFVESRVTEDGTLPADSLRHVFDAAYRRELDAQVYTIRKQSIDLIARSHALPCRVEQPQRLAPARQPRHLMPHP